MGTHRLRRTLARATVVSLCAAGVMPLSSGTAHAAPPSPRTFNMDPLGVAGFTGSKTLAEICTKFNITPPGTFASPLPTTAQQDAFNAANGVKIQFDDDPVPPLGAVSAITLTSFLVGPKLLFGLGGSLLQLEIVDQASALDVTIPNGDNDLIIAGDGDNVILGGAGNDYICGNSGGDVINGGSGDDEIVGGSGEDVILGGSGDDNAIRDADDILCYLGSGNNLGCP